MEIISSLKLINLVVAFPFVVVALLLLSNGMKLTNRFFFKDYRGDPRDDLKDNILSGFYLSLSAALLIIGGLTAIGEFNLWALCLGPFFVTFVLPLSVIGSYWRRYLARRMIGGSLVISASRYGFYEESEPPSRQAIDPSTVKVPRRVKVTSGAISLYIFGCTFYLLNQSITHIEWFGILISLVISGLIAFGTFSIIIASDRSHRLQKLREGEPVDDD